MRKLILFLLLSITTICSYGQGARLVHGCVFGKNRAPLQGAIISNMQGEQICVTDASGQFSTTTKAYLTKIQVSYKDYTPQIVTVDGSYMIVNLNVKKVEDISKPKKEKIKEELSKERQKKEFNAVEIKRGYQQETSLAYSFLRGDAETINKLSLNYIGGYRFNHHFFIGIGTGLTFGANYNFRPLALDHASVVIDSKKYSSNQTVQGGYASTYYRSVDLPVQKVSIPLYVHFRTYFMKTKWAPFLAFSAGINISAYKKVDIYENSINWDTDDGFHDYTIGEYRITDRYGAVKGIFEVMPGINYQHSKDLGFNFQFGYTVHGGDSWQSPHNAGVHELHYISSSWQHGCTMRICVTF